MSKPNANNVLFGDGPHDDEVINFDEIVAEAEQEYDARFGPQSEGQPDVGDDDDAGDLDADGQPEPGADESDDDGADDAGDADELEGSDAGGAEGEPADGQDGDGGADAGSGETAPTGPESVELKFASQTVAEKAYEDLRAEHNRLLFERQQWQAEQAARQQAIPQQAPAAPVPDANQDPVAAFRAHLANGEHEQAQQVIALVNMHASQFSAQAAQLRADGDDDAAALYENRALNAHSFAESMRHERLQAEYDQQLQAQVAPLQEAQFVGMLNQSAAKAMQDPVIASAYKEGEHDQQIARFIQENPEIMGNWSQPEVEYGFKVAAQQVIFGGQQQMIEHIVAQRVAEQIAAAQAQPPQRPPAARAGGGGTGRRTPPPPSPEDSEASDTQNSLSNNIPSGMSVLFGGGQ